MSVVQDLMSYTMSKNLSLFNHTTINNNVDKTIFLFHGTGGTKEDFFFLDTLLAKKYNLVGIQGNVDENGMSRFFRRFDHGVFDQKNIKDEVNKLYYFISSYKHEYPQQTQRTYFLGYSNGANILLAALFSYPILFNNLILLHAMLPFENEPRLLDLSSNNIFLSHGDHDQMVSPAQQQVLNEILASCRAHTEIHTYDAGHSITKEELQDVLKFLAL